MDIPANPPGTAPRVTGRGGAATQLPPGLDARSAAVLREIVEQYVETGEPVGSRTLSRLLPMSLSPATIRNVMADLTEAGLLFAPHTSAGRLPTDQGLRLVRRRPAEFRRAVGGGTGHDIRRPRRLRPQPGGHAGVRRAGCCPACRPRRGWCWRPKSEGALRHIEFVPLGSGRALVILVSAEGQVENRVIEIAPGTPPSALQQASNYLNARLSGRPLAEVRHLVAEELAADRSELDALTSQVVGAGLATWTAGGPRGASLIIRGQGRLLSDVTQIERLAAIQALFERLEAQETMLRLLELAEKSEGVRIFIGAESGLFGNAGLSMVVAPARSDGGRIVGAIGVIGPTRINYGRIIPVVDYTARVIGRLLG